MTIEIKPRTTAISSDLPLGFEAGADLAEGRSYVFSSGERVNMHSLDSALVSEGAGSHSVAVTVQFRQPGTPVAAPLREITVRRDVVGMLDTETLGRVVHESVRAVYDRLRQSGTSDIGDIGELDDDEPSAIGDSGTPEEVFIAAISIT